MCPFNRFTPAHPRWRGEHDAFEEALKNEFGSSPLARGALRHVLLESVDLRLIPAGAGSTIGAIGGLGKAAAHPRWRGEHR